jgi:cell division protein ZapA (FtsZ GTPase activity inhibitor)
MLQVRQVTLQIAGQTLRVRTDAAESELHSAVASVETQLRALAGGAPVSDIRVILLALLTATQENQRLRAELLSITSRIDAFADEALLELKQPRT